MDRNVSVIINMRLSNPDLLPAQQHELREFSEWVLAAGDGSMHENNTKGNEDKIRIPSDLIIHAGDDKMLAIINAVYNNISTKFSNLQYLESRAIVCPNNETVDEINLRVLDMVPGKSFEFLSCDSISKMNDKLGD